MDTRTHTESTAQQQLKPQHKHASTVMVTPRQFGIHRQGARTGAAD
jgi:hypothetical protein